MFISLLVNNIFCFNLEYLLKAYEDKISAKEIEKDEHQCKVIDKFMQLDSQLKGYKITKPNFLSKVSIHFSLYFLNHCIIHSSFDLAQISPTSKVCICGVQLDVVKPC